MNLKNFKNFINLKTALLLLIVLIAIFLRFWQLGSTPPSPDWDEVALGYNAYSIMETGRDEYGKFLPVILRSFDDYKPALYAYLIIPFIKLFGLNLIAVRLPSAIFGVIGVLLTYLLVKELFGKHPKLSGEAGSRSAGEILALLSAFLFAISPWDLQFSRIGFEAQVGMVLNIGVVLFFIKGLKRGPFLLISAALGAASIYVYQSEKVYLPILLLALVIIYRKELLAASRVYIVSAILLGIVLSLPMASALFFDQGALMRAKGVVVFSENSLIERGSKKLAADHMRHDYLGILIDNRRVEYAKAVVSGYISHFNPNWLFITGDIERHHAPGMGLLYLFELPFLLIGLYILVFGDYSKKTKLTLLAIFLAAPIPASVTSGVPHAVRTINFLPTFQIFTALGLIAAYLWVFRIRYKVFGIRFAFLITIIYLLFTVFNFSYYLNQYFVQQNYNNSKDWQYGYEQAIDFIKPIKNKYSDIIVTNKGPLDQSYIFFLYYLKYDPRRYQNSGGTGTGGFAEEHKGFDNFKFHPIDWDNEKPGSLVIGRPEDIKGGKILQTINYLDGKPAIVIAER